MEHYLHRTVPSPVLLDGYIRQNNPRGLIPSDLISIIMGQTTNHGSYCGYLLFQQLQQHHHHRRRGWRRKYFVIHNNRLLCATSTPLPNMNKLQGQYHLEGAIITKKHDEKKGQWYFEVSIRRRHHDRNIFLFRARNAREYTEWTKHLQKASTLKIKEIYSLQKNLCSPNSSKKMISAKHRSSGHRCVIQFVDQRQYEPAFLRNEISILQKITKLSHLNVVPILDLFMTRKYLYIISDRVRGEHLLDAMDMKRWFEYTPHDCCRVIHQIASGIQYMHKVECFHCFWNVVIHFLFQSFCIWFAL